MPKNSKILNLTDLTGNVRLVVDEALINELAKVGMKHFPNEFGGFLIGKYSDDFKTLYIGTYLLPVKFKNSPTLFQRSINGIEKKFTKVFEESQQYYVGEWHTHPNGSTKYSSTDLHAMNKTVECDTVHITNPVLLILSISRDKINDYTFYYYDTNKLIPYGKKDT